MIPTRDEIAARLDETRGRRRDLLEAARVVDDEDFDALMAEVDRLTGLIDALMDRTPMAR